MEPEELVKVAIKAINDYLMQKPDNHVSLAKAMDGNVDYKNLSHGNKSSLGKMVKSQIVAENNNIQVTVNNNYYFSR